MKIIIESKRTLRPFSEDERKNPSIKNLIDQCKKNGWEHCESTVIKPEFSKWNFNRRLDKGIFTNVVVSGLKGGNNHVIKWKLLDPHENVHQIISLPIRVPLSIAPKNSLDFNFRWEPRKNESWPLGEWKVIILIDDETVGFRKFEVSEDSANCIDCNSSVLAVSEPM